VSTSSAVVLPLAGISQRPHDLVRDLHSGRGNDEQPIPLFKRVVGEGLDAQSSAIGGDLNLAWSEPEVVTQLFWDNQSARLVNGCPHA
jgi:hypothetical protein